MKKDSQFEKYVGRLFGGRYRIEAVIGSGGMSVVFRATDTAAGRTVAVKMLKDEISEDLEALRHLENESRAVGLLSHPNIIGIYDVSFEGPEKYLVMEYVEGISLRTYMDRKGKLSFNEVVKYSEQILAALEHAHSKGVVHRDIKPQNIMLLKDGLVKVTDFGIARIAGEDTFEMTSDAIGTVYYVSPEQAEGNECDCRSDLYSLGVMMYEMATGKLPFYSSRAASVLMMHIREKPVPPRVSDKKIPRGLEQIILCAMEKDPDKRYLSAVDMFRELRRIEANKRATVLTPVQIKRKKRSDKNKEEYRPSSSSSPVVLGIAFALLIVAVIAIFIVIDRLNIADLGEESISVPDVTGKTYLSASAIGGESLYEAQLKELGLGSDYIVSVDYVYSDGTYPSGMIISQSPEPGSHRKSPCRIKLTVSLGVETTVLGDCSITDYRAVRQTLRNQGLNVSVEYTENAVIPNGYVISTEPGPGTVLNKGDSVLLIVSRGISTSKVPMPDCVGKSESETRTLLDAYQLFSGNVIYTKSTEPAGTVLEQSIEPDSTVYSGVSVIDFVVSGGPEFDVNYYPDVRGKAVDEAARLLEKLGLEVELIPVASYSVRNNVIKQTPVPGTVDKKLKKVSLQYSAGEDYSNTFKINTDVKGLTVENAEIFITYEINKQCEEKKLNVGIRFVHRTERSDAAVGTVISQSPAPGGTADASGGQVTVILRVSGGKNYVPNVIGMDVEEATDELTSAGYRVSVEYSEGYDDDVGLVISMNGPTVTGTGDETVETVTIVICTGGVPMPEEPPETTAAG